jgi:hypothetical protein
MHIDFTFSCAILVTLIKDSSETTFSSSYLVKPPAKTCSQVTKIFKQQILHFSASSFALIHNTKKSGHISSPSLSKSPFRY